MLGRIVAFGVKSVEKQLKGQIFDDCYMLLCTLFLLTASNKYKVIKLQKAEVVFKIVKDTREAWSSKKTRQAILKLCALVITLKNIASSLALIFLLTAIQ